MYHKLAGRYFKLSKIRNVDFYERKFMLINRDCPYILSFDYDSKKMINLNSFNFYFFSFSNESISSLEDERIKIYYSNIDMCKNEVTLINNKLNYYNKIIDEEIANFEKKIMKLQDTI